MLEHTSFFFFKSNEEFSFLFLKAERRPPAATSVSELLLIQIQVFILLALFDLMNVFLIGAFILSLL